MCILVRAVCTYAIYTSPPYRLFIYLFFELQHVFELKQSKRSCTFELRVLSYANITDSLVRLVLNLHPFYFRFYTRSTLRTSIHHRFIVERKQTNDVGNKVLKVTEYDQHCGLTVVFCYTHTNMFIISFYHVIR